MRKVNIDIVLFFFFKGSHNVVLIGSMENIFGVRAVLLLVQF